MTSIEKAADPVATEIIRNRLVAITDEMKINLMRTAYNMVIYEALDYTVGLFDREGETISIGLGLPMFIRGLSDTVKAKIEHYGEASFQQDDVIITNDAYITGNHINHIVVTQPIFYDDRIVAYSSAMAHWQDIGGVIAGITKSIYEEGLQLPILKLYDGGELNNDLIEIIKMNVRQPDVAMGDLRAELAAIRTGRRRYLELVERYGLHQLDGSIAEIKTQSEVAARSAVESIPDGVYEAESFMDDDGVELGKPIRLKVRVVVSGDDMSVDLTGLDDQVAGYFNAGRSAGRSAAEVAFKCLTSPTTYPINEGSFRPVSIVLPPGKLLSATRPAAMRCWMNPPMTVTDTIFRALAPAIPKQVAAGHHADLLALITFGTDSRRGGRFYIGSGGLPGGGWGAKSDDDGMSAVICMNDGDTHNAPVESVEAKFPVLFEKYELRQDSGGPGTFRGGLGTVQVRRVLDDCTLSSNIDRTKCPPWGLLDGKDGDPNGISILKDDEELEFHNGKISLMNLSAGDRYVLKSGGGGGFGDPLMRDPEMVLEDVIQGYVSLVSAFDDYGVVILEGTLAIDWSETMRRRAELTDERLGH